MCVSADKIDPGWSKLEQKVFDNKLSSPMKPLKQGWKKLMQKNIK